MYIMYICIYYIYIYRQCQVRINNTPRINQPPLPPKKNVI